jgi:ATP-dependent helicase/DNAse subunit B
MRIWKDPLNESQMNDLSKILREYHENIQGNYMEIFDEISLAIDH